VYEGREMEISMNSLPNIRGDSKLLHQVFSNLISNAMKYTEREEVGKIEIGSKIDKDYVTYFVKDNGVGFDMKYVHKLFGVFQRLHSEKDFEGTGVGLALVQKIVHRHGGNVWAEGKVNEGATFFFSLPVKE
ncbi:MAG: ATP-binding protein, partial [bacterium]